jgi:hypothetical protein
MEPRNDRPPTSGEVFWGYFLVGLLGLYVLVVMIRPTYDLLASL